MESDQEGRPIVTFTQHTFSTETPEVNNSVTLRQDSTELDNHPPPPRSSSAAAVGIDAILGGARTVFNGCTVVLNVNVENQDKSEDNDGEE